MHPTVIETLAVSKHFGDVLAVDAVTLSVSCGEVFGLIGHNGAGKTTLFRMMLGLLAPSAGEIRVAGQPVNGASFRELRRRVAYVPESVVLYDNLTGIETLQFFSRLKRAATARCAALLEKVGLGHAARRPVRHYSKGMRQRLGFAQALIGDPEILFLDEPTAGLDPEGISDFYRILAELRQQGVTALLSSHNLAEIEERVDRLALMKRGRIEATGTVQGLREGLRLPLRMYLRMSQPEDAGLRRVLAGVPGCDLSIDGAGAVITCARERKMAVLRALASLTEEIEDIQLREPSLEDVFLGYANGKDVRN